MLIFSLRMEGEAFLERGDDFPPYLLEMKYQHLARSFKNSDRSREGV